MKRIALILTVLLLAALCLAGCGKEEPDKYTVSFDYATGDAPIKVTVTEGETVTEPNAPKRNGYTFLGWTLNGTAYNFSTPVTENISLVAKWEEVKPLTNTITYYFYEGYSYDGYYETLTVERGTHFVNKECDVYASIAFDGWYTSDGKLYNESTTVTEDITVYANVYTKGLKIEDGVVTACDTDPAEIIIPKYYSGAPVTKIAKEAFKNKSASKISLPDTLTEIGERAFYNCKSIENVYIPDSVDTVGFAAFGADMTLIPLDGGYNAYLLNTTSLKSISIPKIYGDDESAYLCYIFGAPAADTNNYSLGGLTVTHEGVEKTVHLIQFIPVTLESVVVRQEQAIPTRAFANCFYVTSVEYTSAVTAIGDYAFDGCSSVNVKGVSAAETIGYAAFRSCPISTVEFTSVKEIGNYAFASTGITEFSFPEGLEAIGTGAFALTSLTDVILPSTLKSLGSAAFYGCNELENVTFTAIMPPEVGESPFTTIDENGTLYYSTVSIWVPAISITGYRDRVYLRDYASRIFPVENRGDTGFIIHGTILYGFIGEGDLTVLEIPAGVTEIASYSFYGVTEIENIILPDGFLKIGKYSFYDCIHVSTLSMPSTMKEIDDYAFAGFFVGNELTRLYFPEGFERIGDGAFMSSFNLKIVDLPSTIKYIGYLSFGMSNYLEAMYIKAEVPPTVGTYVNGTQGVECDIFSIVNSAKTVIYVPNGEKWGTRIFDSYREAPGFSNFASIIKVMPMGKEVGHYGDGTVFLDLDGAGIATLYYIVESEDNTADFAGAKYEYVKTYGTYTLSGTALTITINDDVIIEATYKNRTASFTYLEKSYTLAEPKSYYDSYNWTNFKLYPQTENSGLGVFDMYGSFLTPFTYVIEGGVFKMSVDGNNTAPGHEDYFGVQEYIGTYDAEKDTFNVSFMLNDYEELMEYNAERISPIYATVDEMMFVGTYINYHLSGSVKFKIISYGNGMCEFYIGTNAYTDLKYTAQGNEIRISVFGLMISITIDSDGNLNATGQDLLGKGTHYFVYSDEVRDPTKLPSRENV